MAGLAELLAATPPDPFTPEVVSVPTRGVERWIAQSLSATLGAQPGRADGVCANVIFPPPGRLVRDAVAAATLPGEEDPWEEPRLVWHVLEAIDSHVADPWCAALARHLGGAGRPAESGRRMAAAQKLARLFTSYAEQRGAMVMDWLAGKDTDGHGAPLGPDHGWQAELWRQVRAAVGVPNPAERTEPACVALRADPQVAALPGRLSVFGPTRLSSAELRVLDALAAHREVHLWLPSPSHGLWERVRAAPSAGASPVLRLEDPTARLPRHPLLRSLGRDARELQLRLAGHTLPASDQHLPLPEPAAPTLLAALQRDLAADRAPTPGAAPPAAGDRSLQVHACHGRHRQVEVLREVLLGLLADDPTLELRDVIVMCPDVEAFAPLLAGAFGLSSPEAANGAAAPPGAGGAAHPGQRLTVRLADRSPRHVNAILDVAARLLELADARLSVAQVLDLAALPPVRRRFGLDDDALDLLARWAREAGVRYGLDAAGRARWGLGHVPQNTWAAGLDRLLTGVAMDEHGLRLWAGTLPLDDVESSDVDLAGRFAEFLDRLARAVAALSREQPLERWAAALDDAVALLALPGRTEEWQVAQFQRILATATAVAGPRAGTVPLVLDDVRALLAPDLLPRASRTNFRTGSLTLCSLMPMRSVPHRVVVLLGMDDADFPRATRADGDDILAREPRVGERDARAEDRQLLLDAILAATEHLVVLHSGAHERTGAALPPAVPVGELLDVVERMRPGSASRVVVRHPLQPFDPRNFTPGALEPGGNGAAVPFSFDGVSFAGARALQGERHERGPFLPAALPAAPVTDLELDALIRFLEHPTRYFLSHRLELSGEVAGAELCETVPVALDGLERWAIGDRLLTATLAGTPLERALAAERARGEAPPGRLGELELDGIAATVAQLLDRGALLRVGAARQRDVAVDLPGPTRLTGTIGGMHGTQLVRVMYAALAPKQRLRAWVQLLALSATAPGTWTAHTLGRGSKDRPVDASRLTAPAPEVGRALLDVLAEVHRRGMRQPLPFAPRTSAAYAQARAKGRDPAAAARAAARGWSSGSETGKETGECGDAAHRRAWAPRGSMDALLAAPADPGLITPAAARVLCDPGDAVLPALGDEPHLFGQLAQLVFAPLLAAEELS